LSLWENVVWYVSIVLTAALLVKLWSGGLIKIYKLFFCYLAWDFLSSLIGLSLTYNTNEYGYFYLGAQALKIVIAAFMLAEIYGLAFERTPALAQFGRSTVGYILGGAALIPAVGLLVDRPGHGQTDRYLHAVYLFEQTMDSTIAIFLILISLFMAWFPVKLRRNVIIYISGFIVWSLTRSAAAHLANQFPQNLIAVRIISLVQMCIGLGCLLLWLGGLQREGETRTAVVGHLWNRAEADRLTEQLDAINDSLARLRRH
jgi:hypothetical protein